MMRNQIEPGQKNTPAYVACMIANVSADVRTRKAAHAYPAIPDDTGKYTPDQFFRQKITP
jgi:hypothetical protein